jgi:molecular chaperone DnaK (HSP70)
VVALNEREEEVVVYLIHKNTQVPATEMGEFATVEDNQESVLIRIMEAEGDQRGKTPIPPGPQCREIKQATLDLPPGLSRGSLIDVRYDLSEDGGRLRVTAVEKKSARSIEIDVQTVDALTTMELVEKKERLLKMVVQ